MKRFLGFLYLFFIGFNVVSQQTIEKKFTSNELGEARDLKIYLPEGYQKDSINNYPLAVVLDTEHLFDIYVANSKLFALTDKAPKQIVVGISLEKTREKDTAFDENTLFLTNENVQFLYFIRDELVPYMEGTYRTSPFMSVIGQGDAVNIISSFLKDNDPLFNAYICISPNFSPIAKKQVESFAVSKLAQKDNTYYFYINNLPFFDKKKQEPIIKLKTYLSSIDAKNFNVIYDELNSPNYISSLSEAIPRAISGIFELYAGITKKEYETKLKDMSPNDAISYLENKYLDIDFLFGSNLGIREKDIFAVEELIIDKEEGDYLRDFGKMILNIYPTSHLGDYYNGLYYENRKQIGRALEHYKRGYGKMSDNDPNKELFYGNIERLNGQ